MTPASLWVLCALLAVDGATLSVATTPLLIAYGRYHAPWVVAVAGGLSSAFGSAFQLQFLRWAVDGRHPWMSRFAPSREKLSSALHAHPSASFLALVVARATPLPDAPLKLVAAAIGYPIPRYAIAVLIGSLPYYFALAYIGEKLRFPTWLLLAAIGVVVVAAVVDLLRRRRKASA
jgi:uncharacterized membrane protein YdjX (TVP38/TMEM64 family)